LCTQRSLKREQRQTQTSLVAPQTSPTLASFRAISTIADRLTSWLACGFFPHDRRVEALFFCRHSNYLLYRKRPHVANIKSQIKRNKTNEKAHERNKAVKSELKTHVRATRAAVASGDKAAAEAALKTAARKLDKAVSKGVIHQNQAANRKSAIAKQVAAL
jgi:small subunit ribosomal protein S20